MKKVCLSSGSVTCLLSKNSEPLKTQPLPTCGSVFSPALISLVQFFLFIPLWLHFPGSISINSNDCLPDLMQEEEAKILSPISVCIFSSERKIQV